MSPHGHVHLLEGEAAETAGLPGKHVGDDVAERRMGLGPGLAGGCGVGSALSSQKASMPRKALASSRTPVERRFQTM